MLEMNWKKELITEQQKLKTDCKCPNCGGDAFGKTFDCQFCGKENQELKEDIKNISGILENCSEEELKSPFVMISLKKMEEYSPLVSSMDREEIEKEYLTWSKKMIDDLLAAKELSKEDQEGLINLFDNGDYYQEQIAATLQNMVIANTATQRGHYSPEVVYGALYQYYCQIIKPHVKDAKMEKKKLKEDRAGESEGYTARLDEESFNNFMNGGGSSVINIIGHEARHVYQHYKRFHRIVEDRNDLIMFYESIVENKKPEMYDENYINMLSEIDARVFGSMFEQQFLKTMLGFSDEKRKRDFKADCDLLVEADTMRVIDEKQVHLEDAVLTILKEEPSLYDKWSQFRYEFTKEGQEIRRKTTNELIDDYLNNKDDKKDNLYLALVTNSKKLETLEKKRQQKNPSAAM